MTPTSSNASNGAVNPLTGTAPRAWTRTRPSTSRQEAAVSRMVPRMAGSKSCWAASGSRPSLSLVESWMSAKKMVTCWRFPSRAVREARI